ncbi:MULTISPECIES: hypothetical protein [Paraburkholderia]|uniref:hypothetical protein n=1 Tax=Paraburkholderia TaxID=1822464 RepID=UPI0038BA6E3B
MFFQSEASSVLDGKPVSGGSLPGWLDAWGASQSGDMTNAGADPKMMCMHLARAIERA